MRQAFKAVDKDSSGTVERRELDRLFDSFHVHHSQQDIDDLFNEYDKNNDGVFSYGEFVKLLSTVAQ
jgi:Ca2+-binding EF-hand superfamily protein